MINLVHFEFRRYNYQKCLLDYLYVQIENGSGSKNGFKGLHSIKLHDRIGAVAST